MTINGVLGTLSRDDARASDPGHGPVLLAGKLKASDGVYPIGLLLTRKSDGNMEPLQVVADEVLDTGEAAATAVSAEVVAAGTGSAKTFTKGLVNDDVTPGSVVIAATVGAAAKAMTDDGAGNLSGTAGVGSVDYATGLVILYFTTAPDNATNVTVNYSHTPPAKTFSGTLAAALPVMPGSLSITDGVETFTDDGAGKLVGSAGGTGTINYKTGVFSVTFSAAPLEDVDVEADYITKIAGVLDELVDTTKSASGLYIKHGTCRQDMLKVGATLQTAPSATLLAYMQDAGIYPV